MNKALTYIGLCKKAGKLSLGTEFTRDAVRQGRAVITLVATDASENSKKRLYDSCSFYNRPKPLEICTAEELARATGKKGAVAAVGICDEGFAKAITDSINKE